MTRVLPFLKTAIPTLLLAVVAPTTTGLQADTSAKTSPPTSATTYSVLITTATSGTKPAIETLPKSMVAWEFDHEQDGTVAIKGPSGTIWHGNLQVNGGPMTPQSRIPNYRLYITPNAQGQNRYFQIVPPNSETAPRSPNLSPLLPPGQSQPKYILPKLTP